MRKMTLLVGLIVAAIPAVALAARPTQPSPAVGKNVCSNTDGALTNAAFVFVESPASGDRVSNGFKVHGCSSTFEGTVTWQLVGRNGRALAHGFIQGGSVTPRQFGFAVHFAHSAREVGHLTVGAPRVTNEGFPPATNAIPLVLEP
jgi:hypothetical protein